MKVSGGMAGAAGDTGRPVREVRPVWPNRPLGPREMSCGVSLWASRDDFSCGTARTRDPRDAVSLVEGSSARLRRGRCGMEQPSHCVGQSVRTGGSASSGTCNGDSDVQGVNADLSCELVYTLGARSRLRVGAVLRLSTAAAIPGRTASSISPCRGPVPRQSLQPGHLRNRWD